MYNLTAYYLVEGANKLFPLPSRINPHIFNMSFDNFISAKHKSKIILKHLSSVKAVEIRSDETNSLVQINFSEFAGINYMRSYLDGEIWTITNLFSSIQHPLCVEYDRTIQQSGLLGNSIQNYSKLSYEATQIILTDSQDCLSASNKFFANLLYKPTIPIDLRA